MYQNRYPAQIGAPIGDDVILAVARLMLVSLFLVFGWDKMTHFDTTMGLMSQRGLPVPPVAAAVAVAAEVPLCLLLLVGAWTRPTALALVLYTLATAFIGHRFWELDGAARVSNAINFYKNWGIAAGFLLLYVTGAGKYSVDAKLLQSSAYSEATP